MEGEYTGTFQISEEQLNYYDRAPYFRIKKWMFAYFTLDEAMWLTNIEDKYQYFKEKGNLTEDGWFYLRQKDIWEEIPSLTVDKQTAIIKNLQDIGVLNVRKKGLPARYFYKIDFEKMKDLAWWEYKKNSSERNLPSLVNGMNGHKRTEFAVDLNNNKAIDNKGTRTSSSVEKEPTEEECGAEPPASLDSQTSHGVVRNLPSKMVRATIVASVRESRRGERESAAERIRPHVADLVESWMAHGLRRHNLSSKLIYDFQQDVAQLGHGTFFQGKAQYEECVGQRFSAADVKGAIENFALAATDPSYLPDRKDFLRHLTIRDFLYYDPHGMSKVPVDRRSFFITYLAVPPPSKNSHVVIDLDPAVTKVFRERFVADRNGGVGTVTDQQENDFRRAAARCLEWYKRDRDKLNWPDMPTAFASRVCDALVYDVEARHRGDWTKVTSGWYCHDALWVNTLPAWLKDQAVTGGDENEWRG